jgi:hypothetical protein
LKAIASPGQDRERNLAPSFRHGEEKRELRKDQRQQHEKLRFADVPSTSGSAERMANKIAEIIAQNLS